MRSLPDFENIEWLYKETGRSSNKNSGQDCIVELQVAAQLVVGIVSHSIRHFDGDLQLLQLDVCNKQQQLLIGSHFNVGFNL